MQLTDQIKKKIFEKVESERGTMSQKKYATKLGFSDTTYSRIKKGELAMINDQNWITLARKVNFVFDGAQQWHTAQTPTYLYITAQLEHCRRESTTGIFCDKAGIGKSHAAKEFANTHPNVVYIDCSTCKSKKNFVRALATGFGIKAEGRLSDIMDETLFYIRTLDMPLIILDEFGDLEYGSFLEIKAIYNHLEDYCGFYALGADGLRKKINTGIRNERVGFTEVYDRFGASFSKVLPDDPNQQIGFLSCQASMVIKENYPVDDSEAEKIIADSKALLRRVRKEIQKRKNHVS